MIYFILLKIFKAVSAKLCRPLYCIAFGQSHDEFKVVRFVLWFLCGALCAGFFWNLVLSNFALPLKTKILISIVITVAVGFGFINSTFVKCIMLLILVGMTRKVGRKYLKAISFAFIISGPITNLGNNGHEVARVFSCSVALQYNLTKARFDLMFKPFQKTIATMKDDFNATKQTFSFIENVTDPLRNEIENDDITSDTFSDDYYISRQIREENDRAAQVQLQYTRKIEQRCKEQLKRGENRCYRAFSDARYRCMMKLPFIINHLLCWPFKVDFICGLKILGAAETICNPSDVLPNEFGQAYVSLDTTKSAIVTGGNDLVINYTIHNVGLPPGLMKADDMAKTLMRDIDEKKILFDRFLHILQRCLCLLFLRVIIDSILYHKHYCTRIQHDNMYVSRYFRHVDLRRQQIGKRTLMPLKKFERKDLVDLDKFFARTGNEYKEMISDFLTFSIEMIVGAFFLVLDHIFVMVLLSVRENSKVSYTQKGEHKIRFEIKGTGLVARFMRSTLKHFNMHEKVDTKLSNEECLPNPSILATSFYIKLALLYFVIIILIYESSLFLRFNRWACARFYRKREKQRILFLYNKMRRIRRVVFEKMYEHVKSTIVEQELRRKLNVLLILRLSYPKYFNWLRFFKVACRKCLICEEYEDDNFVICTQAGCGSVYCDECWHDIEAKCLYCGQTNKAVTVLNFDEFFEELPAK